MDIERCTLNCYFNGKLVRCTVTGKTHERAV
jgi:hypothetical protein